VIRLFVPRPVLDRAAPIVPSPRPNALLQPPNIDAEKKEKSLTPTTQHITFLFLPHTQTQTTMSKSNNILIGNYLENYLESACDLPLPSHPCDRKAAQR